ncbi:chitosanase [Kocuria sp. HSID16901]|uniref:chitosanase n=1 Tax=Kocuria sp. HSID16901 TaxID=2419505 RepID=UPI00080A861F|nr:chitosanase [Kocuria sp. HSID16901]
MALGNFSKATVGIGALAMVAGSLVVPTAANAANDNAGPQPDHAAAAAAPKDLKDPQLKELANDIVATNENSDLNMDAHYGFYQKEDDGRGITLGIVGFTTGTGDFNKVLDNYDKATGGQNALHDYIEPLKKLSGDNLDGLDQKGFHQAWKEAVKDPKMQEAQRQVRDELYFNPAVDQGEQDGVGALGQFIYYDTLVLNGMGSDPDEKGFKKIHQETVDSFGGKTPAQGVDQKEFLERFLDIHQDSMEHSDSHNDKDTLQRVTDEQRPFVNESKFDLQFPLDWTVNEDHYQVNSFDDLGK